MMSLLRSIWYWLKFVAWIYRGLFLTVAYIPFLVWGLMYEISRSKERRLFFESEYGRDP